MQSHRPKEQQNPQRNHEHTFKILKPNKSNGLPMFKNARVGSCSRVIIDRGVRKAIPLYLKTEGNECGRVGYQNIRTTNASSYRWRYATNALESNKPSMKYSTGCERNRLPVIFKHRTEGHINLTNTSPNDKIYESVEHSYIGNFRGLLNQSSNQEINNIRRRHHRNLSSLVN